MISAFGVDHGDIEKSIFGAGAERAVGAFAGRTVRGVKSMGTGIKSGIKSMGGPNKSFRLGQTARRVGGTKSFKVAGGFGGVGGGMGVGHHLGMEAQHRKHGV